MINLGKAKPDAGVIGCHLTGHNRQGLAGLKSLWVRGALSGSDVHRVART